MGAREDGSPGSDPHRLLDALVVDLDANFADFVRSYEAVVFAVALRVSGRYLEAEDLTAESFLRAYRALRDLPAARIASLRPRSWLLTILLNVWRNSLRDASRRPNQVAVAEVPEVASNGASAEDRVIQDETLRELGRVVATLPPNQRVAVVLRHVVDLSMTEVASIMGVPEGTAKSHTSRGLQRLRVLLGEYSPVEPIELPARRPVTTARRESR